MFRTYISNGDYSFGITERYGWGNYDKSLEMLLEYFFNGSEQGTITIGYINSRSFVNSMTYELAIVSPVNIREFNKEQVEGYVELADVTKYFKKNFNIKIEILINQEERKCVVILYKKTLEAFHLALSMLPRYLPWRFQGMELTEEQTNILAEFTSVGEPELFIAAIEKLKEDAKKNAFKNMIVKLKNKKVSAVKKAIEIREQEIDDMQERLGNHIAERRKLLNELVGLENSDDNNGKELIKYFDTHKNIKIENCHGNYLELRIQTYFCNWEEQAAQALYRARQNASFVNVRCLMEDFKKVFKAVFIDKTCKIKVEAGFLIDIDRGVCHANRLSIPSSEYTTNPHIQQYRCLGEYNAMLAEAARNEDLISVMSIASISAGSINLMELPTARQLFAQMTQSENRFYEMNGECYNFNELLNKLNEEENNGNS